METLELVPFEGTQLQRVEEFDESKFHIKELRIKDLHKNLCKKSPYFHVRLDSRKRTSAAEPAEPNGELRRSSFGTCDADDETRQEDGVASMPQGPTLPNPSEAQREVSAVEQQPSNRTSKRKTRLPGKFRLDSNSISDFPERYTRYCRRSTSKSKVKHRRLKEKHDPVETQFFEVPIEAHEVDLLQCDAAAGTASSGDRIANSYPCTPSERKARTRPSKQTYHSPSSSQKRHLTSKQSGFSVEYSERMKVSTDTEPHEGPSKTPITSSTKWKIANTKETLPCGKRSTFDSEFKEKSSRTSGSKVMEKRSKPIESEFQRTYNVSNGSTEEILPTRWRLTSLDSYVEGNLPTGKILESEMKEKKRRTIESNLKERKSRILESGLKRSYDAPQVRPDDTVSMRWNHKASDPRTGKRSLESESKNKKDRTVESTGKGKKSRHLEGESKRRYSAPNASVEDILPLKWRLPKENTPLESKWKEKSNRTSDNGLKLSYHDRDGSTEKKLPLKRKRSFSDASVEEILPSGKKKTPNSKFEEKINKTPETKSKEKKARIVKNGLKHRSDIPDARDAKPARRVRIPIRKLKSGYTSEDGSSDVERNEDGPGVSYPTFATEMKHSNVIRCFWMGIPADFSTRHMPDHDQFIVLQDAQGLKWEANYLARKKGLSGGWRRFALDHHLEMGDIVVFELVKPLKFLVHITKVSGGENTSLGVRHPVKQTPKKVLKPQAYIGTKRVSSLKSAPALFSSGKRANKDAEGKLPGTKPHLAGGDKTQREGEERESVLMMPASKPNRLFYPGAFKRKRKASREETDHYDDPLSVEESDGEETLETKRVESLPKFKRLSSTEDDKRDINSGMDLQELEFTLSEEPAFVSSLEPQKAGPLSPKPGPKQKLRRVSYFYSTDEDEGNSFGT